MPDLGWAPAFAIGAAFGQRHVRRPEPVGRAQQRAEIARKVLGGVSGRDRDILNRFYVLEQSQEQICLEMGLSYNQFRLLKSRAKARFGELGIRLAAGMGINLKNS